MPYTVKVNLNSLQRLNSLFSDQFTGTKVAARSSNSFASLLSGLQKMPTNPSQPATISQPQSPSTNAKLAPTPAESTFLVSLYQSSSNNAHVPSAQANSDLGTRETLDSNKINLQKQLDSFANMEKAYNDLLKTAAKAGGAPSDYISPNVMPALRQGPGIRDQIDGVEISRSDLYFAMDMMRNLRLSMRDTGTAELPAEYKGNKDVESKFDAFLTAYRAMPTFSGPPGMNLPNIPSRPMETPDAMALREQLAKVEMMLSAA